MPGGRGAHRRDTVRQELRTSIDNLGLRLTVRLGAMLAVGVAALGTIVKL